MNNLLNHSNETATIKVNTGYDEVNGVITESKSWSQLTDSNKQDIASLWIKDHVNTNVNQVMELLAQTEDHCDYDEYMSITQYQDYDEVSMDHINDLSIDEMIEVAEEYSLDIDVDDNTLFIANKLSKLIIDNIDLEQYGQDNGLDPEYQEAYEFWSVSDHFVSMLKDSEQCSNDILGLSVWARYCTGQSICLDVAIQKAAFKVLSDCSYKYY